MNTHQRLDRELTHLIINIAIMGAITHLAIMSMMSLNTPMMSYLMLSLPLVFTTIIFGHYIMDNINARSNNFKFKSRK